jgi:hypothetical protein
VLSAFSLSHFIFIASMIPKLRDIKHDSSTTCPQCIDIVSCFENLPLSKCGEDSSLCDVYSIAATTILTVSILGSSVAFKKCIFILKTIACDDFYRLDEYLVLELSLVNSVDNAKMQSQRTSEQLNGSLNFTYPETFYFILPADVDTTLEILLYASSLLSLPTNCLT